MHAKYADELSKVPVDWERVAEQFARAGGKRTLRHVRHDTKHFGNCVMIIRYRMVSIRFIKDRSDEWIEIKSTLGLQWNPLEKLAQKKPGTANKQLTMLESIIYVEDNMLNWPKRAWYKASLRLLLK